MKNKGKRGYIVGWGALMVGKNWRAGGGEGDDGVGVLKMVREKCGIGSL
jgi:hypothetical protein